jgi:hypothetical protein
VGLCFLPCFPLYAAVGLLIGFVLRCLVLCWAGTLTTNIGAGMAGSKCAEIEHLQDHARILWKIAEHDIIGHAPFTRSMDPSLPGQKAKARHSMKRTRLPSWSTTQGETVTSSILNQESARLWDARSPALDKFHLKGENQDAAAKHYIEGIKEVLEWYDCCLQKIKADRRLVTTRLHLPVATHNPKFAHGVYCDLFANREAICSQQGSDL